MIRHARQRKLGRNSEGRPAKCTDKVVVSQLAIYEPRCKAVLAVVHRKALYRGADATERWASAENWKLCPVLISRVSQGRSPQCTLD
jgi:hypothetical protein